MEPQPPLATTLTADLGVSEEAARVWQHLVRNPNEDVATLCRITAVHDLDRVLKELETAGLTRTSNRNCGAVVVDPALVIDRHIAASEREMAVRREALVSLRMSLPDLSREYERGRAGTGQLPGFEVIVDLDEIRRHISYAAECERIESRYLATEVTAESMRVAQPTDDAALARGIRQRTLVRADALADPAIYAAYAHLASLGESVRTLHDVATQMLIFDDSLAVLPVDPKDSARGAIFIRVHSVVVTLADYFDHLWLDGDPIFANGDDRDAPSGRQARILELIANGTKDERIARILAVGPRTVRRDIASIRTLLGVSSRTEIVAAAIRRGWL